MNDELKNNETLSISDLEEEFERLLDADIDDEEMEEKKESHIEDLESLSPEEREQLMEKLSNTKLKVDIAEDVSKLTAKYCELDEMIRCAYLPEEKLEFEQAKLEMEKDIKETFEEENKEEAEKLINHMKKQIDKELRFDKDMFTPIEGYKSRR